MSYEMNMAQQSQNRVTQTLEVTNPGRWCDRDRSVDPGLETVAEPDGGTQQAHPRDY
jgi:hypothetical protein